MISICGPLPNVSPAGGEEDGQKGESLFSAGSLISPASLADAKIVILSDRFSSVPRHLKAYDGLTGI